jgi:hypothetical protein
MSHGRSPLALRLAPPLRTASGGREIYNFEALATSLRDDLFEDTFPLVGYHLNRLDNVCLWFGEKNGWRTLTCVARLSARLHFSASYKLTFLIIKPPLNLRQCVSGPQQLRYKAGLQEAEGMYDHFYRKGL